MEMPVSTAETPSGGPLWLFLILTVALSWPIWVFSGVLPRACTGAYDFRWLIAQIGVFGPSLAALISSGIMRKELRRNSLRMLPILILPLVVPGIVMAIGAPSSVGEFENPIGVLNVIVGAVVILFFSPLNRRLRSPGTGEIQVRPDGRWVFLSVVFFPGLFLAAWLIANSYGGGFEISVFRGGALAFAWSVLVSFAHNTLLGGPLGEEIGWRGFLLPVLFKRNGPFAASLILGLVWALWHLPIDLYAGFLVKGPGAVLLRIVWTLPMTILFTWFYVRCTGSILVALLLHATIGMLSDLGFSRYSGTLGVFFILMTIAATVVVLFDGGSFPRAKRTRQGAVQ